MSNNYILKYRQKCMIIFSTKSIVFNEDLPFMTMQSNYTFLGFSSILGIVGDASSKTFRNRFRLQWVSYVTDLSHESNNKKSLKTLFYINTFTFYRYANIRLRQFFIRKSAVSKNWRMICFRSNFTFILTPTYLFLALSTLRPIVCRQFVLSNFFYN